MKLTEWLKITGTKQARLARAVGMSNQRMTACVRHGMIPRHDEVVKIYWISLGAVRPEDWYAIDAVPKELQRMLQSPPPKRRKRYVRIDADAIHGKRKRNSWKRSALDH